ncbi:MAG: beta-glucosidase [Candidatus Riflebacteria bacterium]|nr:beta-glucosidase [Candidatus Riflebacteria bacterium]
MSATSARSCFVTAAIVLWALWSGSISAAPLRVGSALGDQELLDVVQKRTLGYFWEFGHPVSGMARERDSSPDTVTTGGTGFGVMALVAGAQRGFLDRAAVVARLTRCVRFLEKADRFHGAWPHWLDGRTGRTIPFGPRDDGGDLVETSFLIQGLLTVRQWLSGADPAEGALKTRIDRLWREVEWSWYARGGEPVLYWHWSPKHGWAMNLPIRGFNECLVTYVLAAASPTHPIPPSAYHRGWARGGAIRNGREYCGVALPLGPDFGGPLFFSHYSFLGLDPRGLSDRYARYWEQNVAHTRINRNYCVANPRGYAGYGERCWGLTASDSVDGYAAHSPTNDLGVISPTAALSAFPYLPDESMKALRFFHDELGDRLFGEHGFVDGFSLSRSWFARSFLAIDQGPIVVMIENHRSGLLWRLFMSCPEVGQALKLLGFRIQR